MISFQCLARVCHYYLRNHLEEHAALDAGKVDKAKSDSEAQHARGLGGSGTATPEAS